MRTLLTGIVLVLAALPSAAQAQADGTQAADDILPSPLLLTTPPPPARGRIVTALDVGYNERAFEPVAGEHLEPQASVVLPLSSAVAVLAQLGVANTLDGRTRVAEQGELLVTPIRHGALALAGGFGARHEYGGTIVATARFVGGRTTERSAVAAGVLLEHPYAAGRDALDLITSIGASHAVTSTLWLGVEAVGSDLEGFWDSGEAEGGATLFVGPTIAVSPSGSWRLVVGGGPVLRTTSSAAAPSVQRRSGYVLRTSMRLGWR
jgi:hypothetical protein